MARLVIFGAGDIARLAHRYFTRDSPHEVAGFAVDGAYLDGDAFLGLPLVAFEEVARRYPPEDHQMFVALSYKRMNRLRAERYAAAKALGYRLASYVSSRCSFLADDPVGDNCLILEDNTIQPFVTIGNDVTLWSGNHVGHDSVIEDHCFVSSHVVISGHVRVGAYSFLGVNATVHNGVVIASGTLVGAGAVIAKDTETKGVYLAPRSQKLPKSSDAFKL
jgi:sugar O-acyltransferase (sialic acid O-acetyltransferase NeuD family)